MRIACLQFAPQVGETNHNLNQADSVLSTCNPRDLDLLVLPEMAFSGYNFQSLQQISPFLERQGSGISSLWARANAVRYNCKVTVGYPESVDVSRKYPATPEYYNAAIMTDSRGETVHNYRKTHLYYTDETWAMEGPEGFFGGSVPGLGQTAMGICMDINPYKFEAPWTEYEFANHVLRSGAKLVVLSMAWLTREDAQEFTNQPDEPDMETLNYWLSRMTPIINADLEEEIIFVFANRSGIEGDAVYAGTSAVIGVKKGEVNVYGILGRGSMDLLVVDTTITPYGKLVFRPPGEGADIGTGEPGGPLSPAHSNFSTLLREEANPTDPSAFPAVPAAATALTEPEPEPAPVAPAIQAGTTVPAAPSAPFTPSAPIALTEVLPSLTPFQPTPLNAASARRPRLPMGPKLSIPLARGSPSIMSPVLDTPTCPSPTPIAPRNGASFADRFFSPQPANLSAVEESQESQESDESDENAKSTEHAKTTENPDGTIATPLDSCTPISDLSSAISEAPAGLFWVNPRAKKQPQTPGWVTRKPVDDDDDESASVASFQTESSAVSGFAENAFYHRAGYELPTQNQRMDDSSVSSWRTNTLSVLATPYRGNNTSLFDNGPTPRAMDFGKPRPQQGGPAPSDSRLSQASGHASSQKQGSLMGSIGDSEPTLRGQPLTQAGTEQQSSIMSLDGSDIASRDRSASPALDRDPPPVRPLMRSNSAIGRLRSLATQSARSPDEDTGRIRGRTSIGASDVSAEDLEGLAESGRGRQRVANWFAKEQAILDVQSAQRPNRSQSTSGPGSRPATSASQGSAPQQRRPSTRGSGSGKTGTDPAAPAGTFGSRRDAAARPRPLAPSFSASVETLTSTEESPRHRPPTPPRRSTTPKALIRTLDSESEDERPEKPLKYYDRDAAPAIQPQSAMI